MKTRKVLAFAAIVAAIIAILFYFLYMQPRRVTPILMYHSISDNAQSSLSVTPENFSRQMAFLKRRGYSVISLDSLVEEIKKGNIYLPKTVVITFDDGFKDNFTDAFPVLKENGMTATVFLITDYVGKKEEYLSWDQVIDMKKGNIDFGGHTKSNVYLPAVKDPRRLWNEIAECREDIERRTKEEARYFCYPTGGFTETVKETVKKAGYKGACTTNRGFGKLNRDIYELKRIKITDSDMNKPFHFRAKLSGYYNLFRSCKSGS